MKQAKTVDVLGTPYEIVFRTEKDDPKLKDIDGYCDKTIKRVVVGLCEPDVCNVENMDVHYKTVLRHELIHAFAFESGLDCNSQWALNEEMTSWVGNQFIKLFKAFQDVDAI